MEHQKEKGRLWRVFLDQKGRIMHKAATLVTAMAAGIGLLAGPAISTASAAAGPKCTPVNKIKYTEKKKYSKVNERDVLVNRTKDTITRQAHFEKTSTTTWKISGGVEATFSAWIFAEVKAHVNAGVDKSHTIRSGYSDTVKVRAGHKLTATRGWRIQQARGYVYHVYSNCQTQSRGGFNFTAPYTEYVSYKTTKL